MERQQKVDICPELWKISKKVLSVREGIAHHIDADWGIQSHF